MFLLWLRAQLRAFLGIVPPKPGKFVLNGTEVLTVLRYHFGLPPEPTIDDLDHREAEYTVNGGSPITVNVAKGSTEFTVDFNRNDAVVITLKDVDTSGNASAPSDPLSFTATDTVPPPAPGGLSVSSIEQV